MTSTPAYWPPLRVSSLGHLPNEIRRHPDADEPVGEVVDGFVCALGEAVHSHWQMVDGECRFAVESRAAVIVEQCAQASIVHTFRVISLI